MNRYDSRVLGKNVTYSNDSRKTQLNNNVLVIGNSGCGKTGSFLYPCLKNLANQSAVICDSKGLLYDMFKDELLSKGYDVQMLNFVDTEKSTIGWNPLDYMYHANGKVSYQSIRKFSETLIPINSADEPVWPQGGQNILSFLLAYILEALPSEDHKIGTIVSLYHALIQPNGLSTFLPWTKEHPDSFSTGLLKEWMGSSQADKMHASYMGFVSGALRSFILPELKCIFDTDQNMDFANIGTKKTALFIVTSDSDRSMIDVTNLLYTQIFQVLLCQADNNPDGKLNVPTTLFLDDFGNCHVNDFDMILSITRSRDIGISCLIQSISQLRRAYGEAGAETIINNMDTILYMASNDLKTAEFIGTRANKTATNILTMPRDKSYLIVSGQSTMLVDRTIPYQYELASSLQPSM